TVRVPWLTQEPSSRRLAPVPTVTSVFRVTPLSVPPWLVGIKAAPPLVITAPPVIRPPARSQEPVAAGRASVWRLFETVPSRLTVPPLRRKVPTEAAVKVVPRFKVPAARLITPLLLQLLPPKVRLAVDVDSSIVP